MELIVIFVDKCGIYIYGVQTHIILISILLMSSVHELIIKKNYIYYKHEKTFYERDLKQSKDKVVIC